MGRPKGSTNKPRLELEHFAFDSDSVSKSGTDKRKKKNSNKFKKAKDFHDLTVTFGKESRKIRDFIESKDDDSAAITAQRQLLSMLIDLIPIAENTYRSDPRQSNAYAMNGLISQVRELIHDIQSTQDRARVADTIVYSIVQPMMLSFGQFVVDNNHHTKRDLKEIIDVRQVRELDNVMNKQAKSLGAYMQTFFEELKTRITKELSE